MEFRSDSERIKSLLNTEELTNIEFTENYSSDKKNCNISKNHTLDTEFIGQYGGKNNNLNYMDDYTSGKYNSAALDSYEKDLYNIFEKARNYRKKIENIMEGGQDTETSEKKKRQLNPTVRLMLDMSKVMKDSGKYPGLRQSHFMKISKAILLDAKKKVGTTDITEEVKETALRMAKNAEQYVNKFKSEGGLESSASKGNIRSISDGKKRRSNSRNSSDDRKSNSKYSSDNRSNRKSNSSHVSDKNKSEYDSDDDITNFSKRNTRSKVWNNTPDYLKTDKNESTKKDSWNDEKRKKRALY